MTSLPFQRLYHADWSIAPAKRWVAAAERGPAGWRVTAPRQVGDSAAFVDLLFAGGAVLAGFDFPLGLPVAYGRATGFADFPTALRVFGQGEWGAFYRVATSEDEISRYRPFYPMRSDRSVRQAQLVARLGVASMEALRRECDRATGTRRPACPLFWTLGANQVGKAAIAGWQEVVAPAHRRGAALWPFDGPLGELAARGGPVLAETYPAEAYHHVGMTLGPQMSKRRQQDRRDAGAVLPGWAARHGVRFCPQLVAAIAQGFGASAAGEDAFDALAGVLGMIEVVEGRRAERGGGDTVWEGWILGQAGRGDGAGG